MCDHMDLKVEVNGSKEYWEGDEYLCRDIFSCNCPDCGTTFVVDDANDLG